MRKFFSLSLCTVLLASLGLPSGVSAQEDYNHPDVVYLTFDDGPGELTPDVLSLLDTYNAEASFFVVEPNVQNYPITTQQIVNEGHTLGSHSVTHSRAEFYASDEAAVGEMNATQQAIQETTGFHSEFVRVPYGTIPDLTGSMKNALTNEGFEIWDWNIDSRDWEFEHNPDAIVDTVISGLEENRDDNVASVILLHDVLPQTVEALPDILDYLTENDYEFRTIENETPSHNFHSQWPSYEGAPAPPEDDEPDAPSDVSLPDGIVNLGDSGPEVEQVQSALNQTGANVSVDGVYDSATRDAVFSFQSDHADLMNDGIYGPQTRGGLEQEMNGEEDTGDPEPSPPSTSLPEGIVSSGDRGEDVEQVQSALNSAGANLTVDGIYGPLTRQAVLNFQSDYSGLVNDGVYGPQTKSELTNY